jgi:hypothetical protein
LLQYHNKTGLPRQWTYHESKWTSWWPNRDIHPPVAELLHRHATWFLKYSSYFHTGDEFDFFKHSGRHVGASGGEWDQLGDEGFDIFLDGAHTHQDDNTLGARKKAKVAVAQICKGGGVRQGGGKKGVKTSDAQRLNELAGEFDADVLMKCNQSAKQTRVIKTACNRERKCRLLMLQEGFDNDISAMVDACRIARRRYQGLDRKPHIREVLGVGHREDHRRRVMQVHGVDICLSFWVWWNGFSKGIVSDVLGEIKHSEKLAKGDLRLVPPQQDWTIKASVCRWMKIYVNDLTQDSPEYLEGEGGAAEGRTPRKFLGGIKVRGVLWHMYENDRQKDTTGQLLFCSKGYFKTVFKSQYGRVTGPATGNFWATDAIRSLMGGYCFKCSAAALNISSTDALTRVKGKAEHLAHITWIKKVHEDLEKDKARASQFLMLLEGDDAATSTGTALPIMRKVAQKFVKKRVGFKIMQLVLFYRDHPTYTLRAVGAPWVQPTGNFQVHCMLYCSIPNLVQYYYDTGKPVPLTYTRWSDGGGDTWNLTLIATGYWLVSQKVFHDVFLKRPEKDHSHSVWDTKVADQQAHTRINPGKGALTPELLLKHLREMSNSDVA